MYHIGMKSSEQLLALVNETNSLGLTLDDVQFGVPSVVSAEEQATMLDPANTKVLISAKENRYPLGHVQIHYDRIDLAEFETIAPPEGIVVPVPATYETVLEGFNAFYYSNLTLDDIDTTEPFPDDFVEDEPLELKASPHSLAYRGSLILVVTPSERHLSDLLNNTDLPGLLIGEHLNRLVEQTELTGFVIAP